MNKLSDILNLDLARLYYSEGLIIFIVTVSSMVIIISFLASVYFIFLKDYKGLSRESLASYQKKGMLLAVICGLAITFILIVFPFAHIWNQTITANIIGFLESK